ncbi:MAG: hypothetical protein ABIL25_08960 [candidate division WOR-3 bacterium]
MSFFTLTAVILVGGFEAGGQIAGVYPFAGLDRFHSSSALVGAGVAYTTGPLRFELGYRYTSLPGVQSSPYRLSLHQAAFEAGYGFLRRGDWGLEAIVGPGYARAERICGSGHETGGAANAALGLGFFQYAGHSRLALGLLHTLFLEKGGTDKPGISVAQLLTLRAGVAYVFF